MSPVSEGARWERRRAATVTLGLSVVVDGRQWVLLMAFKPLRDSAGGQGKVVVFLVGVLRKPTAWRSPRRGPTRRAGRRLQETIV